MERGVVRSSARLSGGGASNGSGSGGGGGGSGGQSAAELAQRAAAAALAASRRARAAERAREVEDSPRELRDKCRVLARAVRDAKHLVVYTGAGISTAADIPDYRGPRGVWTRLQRGEPVGRVEVSRARPTYTHMALAALVARGLARFVVSQNCDGLHVRAGLPRRRLAELHGDMFAERCACRRVTLRAFDTTQRTRRHRHLTRRLCPAPRCGRPLRDTIVHFGERARAAWPLNWAGALRHAAAADVILCLGSSLKVLRRYPRLWAMARPPAARPRLFIVNLQWTPKDKAAALKINARCDAVMRQLARLLRLRVPRYRPSRDPLLAHATPLAPAEAHTCSRRALAPPPPSPPASEPSLYSSDDDASSADDSDDALPLRRLQERLRAPPLAPLAPLTPLAPPHPPSSPDSKPILENGTAHIEPKEELTSFQVSMVSGSATILLRARPRPPRPAHPRARPPAPKRHEDEGGGAALRLRRLLQYGPRLGAKREPLHDGPVKREPLHDGPVKREPLHDGPVKREPLHDGPVKREPLHDGAVKPEPLEDELIKSESKDEDELMKNESKDEDESDAASDGERQRVAAAIIARAVLLCRAQLYPGLHTIIPPAPPAPPPARARPAAPPAPAECAWCARRFGSARCLWYPALDPLSPERVWRRVRGRRYLCTCCPGEEGAGEGAEGEGDDSGGEGGWYGKGYRKGRRRRR